LALAAGGPFRKGQSGAAHVEAQPHALGDTCTAVKVPGVRSPVGPGPVPGRPRPSGLLRGGVRVHGHAPPAAATRTAMSCSSDTTTSISMAGSKEKARTGGLLSVIPVSSSG
jgi:hypothetical protein